MKIITSIFDADVVSVVDIDITNDADVDVDVNFHVDVDLSPGRCMVLKLTDSWAQVFLHIFESHFMSCGFFWALSSFT